jgi:phosphoribosylanthranilate isomerase
MDIDHNPENAVDIPQVKICGLTRVGQAKACAALGADAVGCVFFPASPRHVADDQARAICKALPEHVRSVGVFVDASFSTIMARVKHCGLGAVQLHGRESPQLVSRLAAEGLPVIKALWMDGYPSLKHASGYPATAFLVEGSRGKLPGGNALDWDWHGAAAIAHDFPLIVAGGLTPENVMQAAGQSMASALDVSSGVESSPGCKDLDRVKQFLTRAACCHTNQKKWRIF